MSLQVSEITARGFHLGVWCETCQKDTIHYKDTSNQPAACAECTKRKNEENADKRKNDVYMIGRFAPEHKAPSEAELRVMNRMDMSPWDKSKRIKGSRVQVSSTEEFFSPEEIKKQTEDTQRCHFCNVHVEEIDAHREKLPRFAVQAEIEKDSDGDLRYSDKTIVTADTVLACRKCAIRLGKAQVVRIV